MEEQLVDSSEQNDKTNLLGSPVGEASRSASQSISNKHATDGVGDQQAKLNRILQKTANSYIDVPALNSSVDQSTDKTKDYESMIKGVLQKREYTENSNLLEDTSQLDRTLSGDPLAEEDVKMVRDINSSILSALQSIQINNSENLVIPFNVPKDNA
ncbi:lamtor1 [Trichonephila inaurata madagascariensis]|uniref:Ragulator complex protein LAMTOR1 n=1 Tax=Trichonephila inaurata madagascariensis TaxID=2747483 RepID=A0A8X6YXW8_9ARAC|nr:lamtor1 [Trichonephila inaurata madagascariensis]